MAVLFFTVEFIVRDPTRRIFEDPLNPCVAVISLDGAWEDVTSTMASLQELWTEDATERLSNVLKRTLEALLDANLTQDEGIDVLRCWVVARGAILEAVRTQGGARARQLAIARTELEQAIHLARFAREMHPEPTPG